MGHLYVHYLPDFVAKSFPRDQPWAVYRGNPNLLNTNRIDHLSSQCNQIWPESIQEKSTKEAYKSHLTSFSIPLMLMQKLILSYKKTGKDYENDSYTSFSLFYQSDIGISSKTLINNEFNIIHY